MEPFTYERVKEYTGKVQYRADGGASVKIADKWTARRGEVVELPERVAIGAVRTGQFAHVPADAPLGVDGDREAAPAAPATPTPPSPPAPLMSTEESED